MLSDVNSYRYFSCCVMCVMLFFCLILLKKIYILSFKVRCVMKLVCWFRGLTWIQLTVSVCRRHAATLCSPFILLYGLALCCLQYVWAMELQPELPTTVGTMSLRQLGLDRAQYPCLRLGAMVGWEQIYWVSWYFTCSYLLYGIYH